MNAKEENSPEHLCAGSEQTRSREHHLLRVGVTIRDPDSNPGLPQSPPTLCCPPTI